MKNSNVDKIIHLAMIILGMGFLIVDPQAQTGNLFILAAVVIVGGVIGLVNAQNFQNALSILEKQFNVPLANSSGLGTGTTSAAVLSGGQSIGTTGGTDVTVRPPGTVAQ